MIKFPHQVYTNIEWMQDPVDRYLLEEVHTWLMRNIGPAYADWVDGVSIGVKGKRTLVIDLRTAEQATMVALRWA